MSLFRQFEDYLAVDGRTGSSLDELQRGIESNVDETTILFARDIGDFVNDRTPGGLDVSAYIEADRSASDNYFVMTGRDVNSGETYAIADEPIGSVGAIVVDREELNEMLRQMNNFVADFLDDHPEVRYAPLSDDQLERIKQVATENLYEDLARGADHDVVASMGASKTTLHDRLEMISTEPEVRNEILGFDPKTGESIDEESAMGM